MSQFDFSMMQQMQKELHAKYDRLWGAIGPEQGKDMLLWTYGELSEMGDILKKEGVQAVMGSPTVRAHFIEEFCDVLMYLNDICICFGITPEDIETAYQAKHQRNLNRW